MDAPGFSQRVHRVLSVAVTGTPVTGSLSEEGSLAGGSSSTFETLLHDPRVSSRTGILHPSSLEAGRSPGLPAREVQVPVGPESFAPAATMVSRFGEKSRGN